MSHGNYSNSNEKEELELFIHFLKGLLNPNPIERWTAGQAWGHPFITGKIAYRRRSDDLNALYNNISWTPDWDPTKCKRILAYKECRRKSLGRHSSFNNEVKQGQEEVLHYMVSPNTRRVTDLAGAMSISHSENSEIANSPPNVPNDPYSTDRLSFSYHHHTPNLAGSLGANVGYHYPQHHQHLSGGLSYAGHSTSLSHLHQPMESYNEYGEYVVQPPANLHDSDHHYHAIPPRRVPMGAQSFSGIYYDGGNSHAPPASELGYALQRPGVVPNGNHQPLSHVSPYHSIHQNIPHSHPINTQYLGTSLDHSYRHLQHQQQPPPPPGRFSGSLPHAMISPDAQYQQNAGAFSSSYTHHQYDDPNNSQHRPPPWSGMYRGSSM